MLLHKGINQNLRKLTPYRWVTSAKRARCTKAEVAVRAVMIKIMWMYSTQLNSTRV